MLGEEGVQSALPPSRNSDPAPTDRVTFSPFYEVGVRCDIS